MGGGFLHLGFDDTDSDKGGCTTHLGHLLVGEALSLNAEFMDYPSLVRLNPDVPWKTRGNGAVCLRFKLDAPLVDEFWERVVTTAKEYIGFTGERDLGMVLHEDPEHPEEASRLARRAIREIVPLSEARDLAESQGMRVHSVGSGRGLVGAVSAVGNSLVGVDHTYELLAYRERENWGTERRVLEASVLESQTDPHVFAGSDPETGRVLVTPRGLDPVLMGIRGDTPQAVFSAFRKTIVEEELSGWTIFVTNQGTSSHLGEEKSVSEITPYEQVQVRARVDEPPTVLPGGHVKIVIRDSRVDALDCMAYAPSGQLGDHARLLEQGDVIRVSGGVLPKKQGLTLNVERLEILETRDVERRVPPICPRCRVAMSSLGADQGYECEKCGFHMTEAPSSVVRANRFLVPRVLLPPYRSARHLTKPLKRYGRTNVRDSRGIRFWPWTSHDVNPPSEGWRPNS